jgi:ribosomal protein S18
MKFTQNTPVVQPNTIGNVAVRVSGDPMAYGTGGKEYGALAGAIGQMAKVAKEQQDDADAADVMEARNKIMGSLTESMYGEKGLLTNGIGENAKGLEGRVTDTVQKTFDSISKNYNIRVQRALRGNLSENMVNFQRIAAQQEGREYRKQKDSHYGLSIDNSANMAMLNYQNPDLLDSTINDALRIADWRAKDMGYSEQQRLQERLGAVLISMMHQPVRSRCRVCC